MVSISRVSVAAALGVVLVAAGGGAALAIALAVVAPATGLPPSHTSPVSLDRVKFANTMRVDGGDGVQVMHQGPASLTPPHVWTGLIAAAAPSQAAHDSLGRRGWPETPAEPRSRFGWLPSDTMLSGG